MSGSLYNKIYVLASILLPFWVFFYQKIIALGICKAFFQADTFTVYIVINDLWLSNFIWVEACTIKLCSGLSSAAILDVFLPTFCCSTLKLTTGLFAKLSFRQIPLLCLLSQMIYDWIHFVWVEACTTKCMCWLSSRAIWDILLPKFCCST